MYSTVRHPRAFRFTAENKLLRPSMKAIVSPRVQWAKIGRGRDRGFPRPPAQIRAGRITALGSYLEYERMRAVNPMVPTPV